MEHAITGQNNLNADADRARSSSRDCKEEMAQKKEERGLMTHWQEQSRSQNKVNRPADSGILIPAVLSLEGEELSGSEINRNDVSRCDQNLTNKAF
jgi:hypothetical protein